MQIYTLVFLLDAIRKIVRLLTDNHDLEVGTHRLSVQVFFSAVTASLIVSLGLLSGLSAGRAHSPYRILHDAQKRHVEHLKTSTELLERQPREYFANRRTRKIPKMLYQALLHLEEAQRLLIEISGFEQIKRQHERARELLSSVFETLAWSIHRESEREKCELGTLPCLSVEDEEVAELAESGYPPAEITVTYWRMLDTAKDHLSILAAMDTIEKKSEGIDRSEAYRRARVLRQLEKSIPLMALIESHPELVPFTLRRFNLQRGVAPTQAQLQLQVSHQLGMLPFFYLGHLVAKQGSQRHQEAFEATRQKMASRIRLIPDENQSAWFRTYVREVNRQFLRELSQVHR